MRLEQAKATSTGCRTSTSDSGFIKKAKQILESYLALRVKDAYFRRAEIIGQTTGEGVGRLRAHVVVVMVVQKVKKVRESGALHDGLVAQRGDDVLLQCNDAVDDAGETKRQRHERVCASR